MATAALNLDDLLRDLPRGVWVAVSKDRQRVVAFGAEIRRVIEDAKSKGEPNPIVLRVPPTGGALLL